MELDARVRTGLGALALGALALSGCGGADAPGGGEVEFMIGEYSVPVEYHTLDNGLRVVFSEDRTAPTVVVAVYYGIGFRVEPQGRTGFAHLFEHMMFQGSENLGKMEFVGLIQENGGILNGSTRFDYTNYFEVVPAHTLETVLWAEADRMRGLDITAENLTNQQGVVKSEVRVNVLNQPYGGFPWLDMPQYANENWHNAHNFYGDLEELDAATLEDVSTFFERFYAPNNAALVITGDFDFDEARAWVDEYFGGIPMGPVIEEVDLSEPRQEQEKRATKHDALANRPAVAFGYHMPDRNTPEYWAMGLLDQILLQGQDSWLHQALVQREGLTGGVSGGINAGLGNMFNYRGPMLWTASLFHDNEQPVGEIEAVFDEVIERAQTTEVDQMTLDRAKVKMRSSIFTALEQLFGFGRADLLASFALFDDDPARINELEASFDAVTPAMIRQVAEEYLRSTNRTVLIVEPGAATGGAQ